MVKKYIFSFDEDCCFLLERTVLKKEEITKDLFLNTFCIYPIKFIIIRCKIICAKRKSANPRSGPIPLKFGIFTGLTWRRRQTVTKNEGLY